MALILGPIQAVLDILPFVGRTSRFLTGLLLFPVALVLSGVTILVAIIAHNLILLGCVLAVTVGGLVFLSVRASRRK
jgi:hypothetical protein